MHGMHEPFFLFFRINNFSLYSVFAVVRVVRRYVRRLWRQCIECRGCAGVIIKLPEESFHYTISSGDLNLCIKHGRLPRWHRDMPWRRGDDQQWGEMKVSMVQLVDRINEPLQEIEGDILGHHIRMVDPLVN